MRRLAALLLAACLSSAALAAGGGDDTSGIVPRYLLQAPNGRSVTPEDFRGRFQLIAFGYTFCPDVCPTTLVEMADILKRLGNRAERLQPIFITVDPERDTAKVLQTYTEFFDARILGLTGSPQLVRRAADNFHIRYGKVRDPQRSDGNYAVDHSAGMILLGPDGRVIRKFAYATPLTDIVAQILDELGGRPATE